MKFCASPALKMFDSILAVRPPESDDSGFRILHLQMPMSRFPNYHMVLTVGYEYFIK